MEESKPSVETLLKAFHMFDEHGLLKGDLCFDPQHFMETVILPHWYDCDTEGLNPGDEVLIEFWSYEHPLNNSVATYIVTNTETGTKMAKVIDELKREINVPMFNKIEREEDKEYEGKLVEVPKSIFYGGRDTSKTLGIVTCNCKVPSLNKEGYLVKHYKGIRGERFIEAKDLKFHEDC
jgi:hypothetical protein